MHAYRLQGNVVGIHLAFGGGAAGGGLVYNARWIAAGYLGMAGVFALFALMRRGKEATQKETFTPH